MRRLTFAVLCMLLALTTHAGLAQPDLLPRSLTNAPDSVKLWTLRHMGDSLVNIGQMTAARQAYEQALTMAQAGTNREALGLGYRAMGYWHESTGDPNGAIGWYLKAMETFRQSGNRQKLARTANFIGSAYNRLNKTAEARRYLLHGITLARQNGYDQELYELYSNLANVEGNAKQYGRAMNYTQQVLAYYKAQKDTASYYITLFNQALLFKNLQQYTRSEQTFRQTLAYANRVNDPVMRGYVYVNIPTALIPQGKLAEAEEFCNRALDWVNKTNSAKHVALEEVNGHLSRIWEERGDYQRALLFYKQQMASHDSVFNEIKNQQVADLDTRYQTRQKEDQIKLLDATNTHQARQIWMAGAGVVVLSGLLAILFWQYRRLGRSRAKIQQQSKQLTLMMKELHHRVKNNLAIVSSLLKLQSNRLDDEKAVQAVRVGQQRVEAMSLIHQRLYQTDQIATVNMQEYVTDLTQSLMSAYGYNPDTFNLQLTVDLPDLDVDVAIPLGLIINEVVTNAFKYAYDDSPNPLLRVELRRDTAPTGAGMTLEVQDNGPGIAIADGQPGGRRSFGKRLITSLTEQLNGQAEWLQQNGTLFRLSMPSTRLAGV